MEVNQNYLHGVGKIAEQISCLEELIGRKLSDFELEDIHSFFKSLDQNTQQKFIDSVGELI